MEQEFEIQKIAERFQEECHNAVEVILKETEGKSSYQDATNVWMFRKMAELQLQINKIMKYIIVLYAILLPVICFSQKPDSTIKALTLHAGIGSWLIELNGLSESTSKINKDTIKCLLLVCDTSQSPHTSVLLFTEQGKAANEGRLAWWQFGYEVCWTGGVVGTDGIFHCYKIYLDINKKPLPKSLVVWMSKVID